MNHTIRFILGSHAHIAYGAGDEEFEAVYNTRLKPFISTLYKYPKIQVTLHYSGVLLHWLEKAHPEFFMLIGDLVSRKQVEMLGGGFYEPMMPLLPLSDKIGQIELLTTYLRKQFGKRPQGCLLPVLAWEPYIVGPLNTCGMGYTFLDEGQFRLAGLSGDTIAPCITEDQGKIITIFPILSRIGTAFAQQKTALVLETLVQEADQGKERIICVFPKHIFTENRASEAAEMTYHQFFEDLSCFESYIDFTSPGKIFKSLRGLDKAYFPSSLEGNLMSEDAGAIWDRLPRQFLISYPEANGIYSKMRFTHVLINQLRGDKSRKRTAREELWKAQGYNSFCPASEGGIVHHSIRKAAYKALLGAEKITREKGVFIPSLMNFDFDLDGEEEYLFQEEQINCYIKLAGASVFEFDYLPKTWNYLDTFERGFRRTAFTDLLVSPAFTFQDALDSRLSSLPAHSRSCGKERFELVRMDKEHEQVHFQLSAKPETPYGDVAIEKIYRLKKNTLTVSYTLSNQGVNTETFIFIPSIDLSFPGEGEPFLEVMKIHGNEKEPVSCTGLITDAENIIFKDIKNEAVIMLSADQNLDIWLMPIRTSFTIHNKVRDIYQSTCIMPVRLVSLDPGMQFQTRFNLQIYHNPF